MKSFKKKESSLQVASDGGYHPSISVDEKMIPELADMKVGDEIELSVKCRLVSVNKYRSGETNYTLDVEEGEADIDDEETKKGESQNEDE